MAKQPGKKERLKSDDLKLKKYLNALKEANLKSGMNKNVLKKSNKAKNLRYKIK